MSSPDGNARPEIGNSLRSGESWSYSVLRYLPIKHRGHDNPTSASPAISPPMLPRRDFSITASNSPGEVFAFGGENPLNVNEQWKNDLYSISLIDLTATLVETAGQLPPPRAGHCCITYEHFIILWGGYVRWSELEHLRPNSLHVLDLETLLWSTFTNYGRVPDSRRGHTMTRLGHTMVIFGGNSELKYMNDLWEVDLQPLRSIVPGKVWRPPWVRHQTPDTLAGRTDHTAIPYQTGLYIFGGFDGRQCHNDVWKFDLSTRSWEQLDCQGFRPTPRSRHKAVVIEDTMHIYGGKTAEGDVLDDILIFKFSESRWYELEISEFLGPRGRWGHSMASQPKPPKFFVFGGDTEQSGFNGNVNAVHVIDARGIDYSKSYSTRSRDEMKAFTAQSVRPENNFVLNPRDYRPSIKQGSSTTGGSTGSSQVEALSTDHSAQEALRGGLVSQRIFLSEQDANLIELLSPVPVACGGFCDLFAGIYLPTQRKLAMKRPRFTLNIQNMTIRFYKEARVWSKFDHPNILPFLGVLEINQQTYLVSPWMELGDLFSFVQNRIEFYKQEAAGTTPEDRLSSQYRKFNEFKIILEIAIGIVYLHSINVIHGDLKACNVLLSDDGQALICDFGLTKALDAITSSEIKGTGSLRWKSPELFHDQPKTLKSDVYAFGMIIAEVLTGDYPLPHLRDQSSILFAIVLHNSRPTFEPMSRLGVNFEPLWNLAAQCWKDKPDERPTMAAVIEELEKSK